MLRLLTIHEAVPGHYLQGVYANRCPSIARAIFWSGVFAEGWAVYVTQVMLDVGYARRRPGAAPEPLEVLPPGGHERDDRRRDPHRGHDRGRGGLADGRRRLPGGGRGAGEVRPGPPVVDPARAPTSSGRWRCGTSSATGGARLAAASGDPRGADAVPEPRVVGGFGETPGFDYREHLEAVISPTARRRSRSCGGWSSASRRASSPRIGERGRFGALRGRGDVRAASDATGLLERGEEPIDADSRPPPPRASRRLVDRG